MKPRFAETYCSSCGAELGPGDAGVSHCEDHDPALSPAERIEADPFYGIAECDRPLPTSVGLHE